MGNGVLLRYKCTTGSYFAVIVPTMFSFSALGTFLLRQFFLTIPRELDEAALIDGATHRQIFFAIMLPLAGQGLTTLALFTFIWTWGSLLWPVTSIDSLRTLPLGLMFFQHASGTQWHYVMVASLLILLPVVIVFVIGQRAFIRGLTVSAVKGCPCAMNFDPVKGGSMAIGGTTADPAGVWISPCYAMMPPLPASKRMGEIGRAIRSS